MRLERPRWWSSRGCRAWLLLPLAALFLFLSFLRRRFIKPKALDVPVIVVGNIAVGGSGKTPVVIWLVEALRSRGLRPAVISRGYGGDAAVPRMVTPRSSAAEVGDEAVLIARRCGCPMWVGHDRVETGRALLAAHPGVDILVTDDGLQHYRLARDIEIVVVDEAMLGNCWPLPAGPLREPLSRLRDAHLLICNGVVSATLERRLPMVPHAQMLLEAREFYRLHDPAQRCDSIDLGGKRLRALAGIGHPQRFFETLHTLGLQPERCDAYPDHHVFTAGDLAVEVGQALLLTEKDAVKCAAFAPADTWVLPVRARIDDGALDCLLERLHGSETT
ncbi:MAG: tetraacyldisaccharide 4'-kinase [Candidatus Dactylopiibacterium carminicum]|uniref:Tetraacyldisaccharide 4'-kinase n=1 Tax=Candidatus Dactylopiibacterium carminicum TaxID=857335 RepID=A0A272EP74_9RHOO|nr:tetraacyldisaccharide 4'-kinase [Candidatus Dactylopiibacterium carminicum]KAF7598194.1 tetraacyldisaccharide 4'-kinase [Candidatus Dactylopiibacterium carminicum]PAS91846.1 MAG: tetraacyldisaccharide 4'-kinase [Candidatus Dactylopiibacterium carminicum]PAS94617.1 MAG: tetraacyldisaccharide 4'-kinase [Candidatus Dactylopiibacterium carminicum]PAS96912.1 MAG: tetraacyldisaccharide 4'-kinase [Candidatus Dactylopiibacterium carminicum]